MSCYPTQSLKSSSPLPVYFHIMTTIIANNLITQYMKQSTRLNLMMILCFIAGLLAGLLLSTSIGYSQTYSRTNLSITLDKQHQSIDTTTIVTKPKTDNTMTFQVTILDYKPNKWFYVLLICIDQPMDSLKIHTFQGSELYNNLLFMCETLYGNQTDDYIGTLDEELFLLRGELSCKETQTLNIGE